MRQTEIIKLRKFCEDSREKGIALIAVLGIMVLVGLLSASIASLSLITRQLSKVNCDMEDSVYRAEGAADRIIWLIRKDRELHPTRSLGNIDYADQQDDELERFVADGTRHELDYYGGKVTVSIQDAAAGKEISGATPDRMLHRPQTAFGEDYDKYERYNNFLKALKDYTDGDDLVSPDGGMEVDDYNSIGLAPLPRNNRMEFREELLLIPGAEEFYTPDQNGIVSSLRIIPPRGLRTIRGRENFFSTDQNNFSLNGDFSETEYPLIIESRKLWKNEQIPLSETLDADILSRVKRDYSMKESGVYTLIVNARPGENLPGKLFTCTVQISVNLTSGRELQYYEWRYLK